MTTIVVAGYFAPCPGVGVAIHPDDGSDVDTLLMNAGTAMYRRQGAGCGAYAELLR